MPKVLISDDLSPRAAEIFRSRGIEVDVKVGLKPDQLRAIVAEYDGLAIRSATKVTKEVLDVATNLKVVGRAGMTRSGAGAGVTVMGATGAAGAGAAGAAFAVMTDGVWRRRNCARLYCVTSEVGSSCSASVK